MRTDSGSQEERIQMLKTALMHKGVTPPSSQQLEQPNVTYISQRPMSQDEDQDNGVFL
jgi:hypothetical protein